MEGVVLRQIFYNVITKIMLIDDVRRFTNQNRKVLALVDRRTHEVVKGFIVPPYFCSNVVVYFERQLVDEWKLYVCNTILRGMTLYDPQCIWTVSLPRRHGKTFFINFLIGQLCAARPVLYVSPTHQRYICIGGKSHNNVHHVGVSSNAVLLIDDYDSLRYDYSQHKGHIVRTSMYTQGLNCQYIKLNG